MKLEHDKKENNASCPDLRKENSSIMMKMETRMMGLYLLVDRSALNPLPVIDSHND